MSLTSRSGPPSRVARGAFGRIAMIDIARPMAPHVHHHCHVLMKASGGDGLCIVDGTAYPLCDDTAILVNAWERHHLAVVSPERPISVLALYIEPGWLAALSGDPRFSGANRFFAATAVRQDADVRRSRTRLLDALAGRTRCAGDIEAAAFDILDRIMHAHGAHPGRGVHPGRATDGPIRTAMTLIAAADGAIEDMGSVARAVGLSRPRFFDRFQNCVGTTPALFANHMRIERAARDLETARTPLVDLSLALGFSDQASFTRFFRRHFGIPPAHYRRSIAPEAGPPAPPI